jgi:hypothetical protein
MQTIDLHDHDPSEVLTLIPPSGQPCVITISALFQSLTPPTETAPLTPDDIRAWAARVGARFSTEEELRGGDWG